MRDEKAAARRRASRRCRPDIPARHAGPDFATRRPRARVTRAERERKYRRDVHAALLFALEPRVCGALGAEWGPSAREICVPDKFRKLWKMPKIRDLRKSAANFARRGTHLVTVCSSADPSRNARRARQKQPKRHTSLTSTRQRVLSGRPSKPRPHARRSSTARAPPLRSRGPSATQTPSRAREDRESSADHEPGARPRGDKCHF